MRTNPVLTAGEIVGMPLRREPLEYPANQCNHSVEVLQHGMIAPAPVAQLDRATDF